MISNVTKRVRQRQANLPANTVQNIVLDARGQNLSTKQLMTIRSRLMTQTGSKNINVTYKNRLENIMGLFSKNPFELDWGSITLDGYNEVEKTALSVFNFDISSAEKIDRCIVYCTGKALWLNKYLPPGTTQKAVLDLRGQPLPFLDRARRMKDEILKIIQANDPKIVLNIEILI